MQDIIQLLREQYPALSSAKKSAASYFLNHYKDLAFATVTELAERIGVSDTTIINLCTDLGFSGFAEFKRAVRQNLRQEQPRIGLPAEPQKTADLQRIAGILQQSLTETLADPDNLTALTNAAQLLLRAQTVYAVGFWTSAALAQEFCLLLRRQGWRAEAIYPSLGDYIDKVLQITAKDVVILYDFNRYITGMQEICLLLQKQNVPIILITDMGPCPCLPFAAQAVHCRSCSEQQSDSSYLFHTAAAVGHLLRSMTSTQQPRIREDYAELREGIFTRFNSYGVTEPDEDFKHRV